MAKIGNNRDGFINGGKGMVVYGGECVKGKFRGAIVPVFPNCDNFQAN
jgi:hypothetical protein